MLILYVYVLILPVECQFCELAHDVSQVAEVGKVVPLQISQDTILISPTAILKLKGDSV